MLLGRHRRTRRPCAGPSTVRRAAISRCRPSPTLYYGGYLDRWGGTKLAVSYRPGHRGAGARGEASVQGYEMASGGRCYSARAGELEEALTMPPGARAGDRLDIRAYAMAGSEAEPKLYKGLAGRGAVADENLPHCW